MDALVSEMLREMIYCECVGGLRVFFLPKKGFRRKYAEIFIHYGSNDNIFVPPGQTEAVEVPAGIAHFMEHKMFEKTWGEAFSAFARLGASANAYTSNNCTSYLFWTLESFRESLALLMDVAFTPYFTRESVIKEQGIIGQEIRMYDDDPGSRLMRETLEALYSRHPVRIDVAGTQDSITQIDTDLLYLCHSSFYRPPNMSLFVAGDLTKEEVIDAVDEALEAVRYSDSGEISRNTIAQRLRPAEPPEVGANREISLPVPIPLVQVAWKLDPIPDDGRRLVIQEIATSTLLNILFGKSSEFFTKVYEDGLVDDLSLSNESWPDYAYATVVAQSSSPEELVQRIWDEIKEAKNGARRKQLEEDFVRSKKASVGRYITLFDSLDTVGEMQVHLHRVGQDIFSYGKILDSLLFELILESLNDLRRDRSVRVIVKDNTKRR
ncbi:MAG: EF-P 5-aminopentanol modification-associated protein YfmH [Bacillota bacterium]|jgi:predicted Zn-dependent peptidase